MVAPARARELRDLPDRELLTRDGQLLRRILARQYKAAIVRPAPGERAVRVFVTATDHPVGWHRTRALERLLERGLAHVGDDLTITLSRTAWSILDAR